MKKKINKGDLAFRVFSSICIFLSICVFSLLRRLSGEPITKMFVDILIILLLTVLNTAILVLHEKAKEKSNQNEKNQ